MQAGDASGRRYEKAVVQIRTVGTQATGVRTPIINEGDDLPEIVVDSVMAYCGEAGTPICDGDIIGITEAVVARAQGNYATIAQIAADVRAKLPPGPVGVVFPILSRNRFAMLLKGIAAGAEGRLHIQLSYPADEVGNHIISPERLYGTDVNPSCDVFSEREFRERFDGLRHEFTGIDYLELYRSIGGGAEIILANDPREILKRTKNAIAADIHTRAQTKRHLREGGAEAVFGLDDFLNESVGGSGHNEKYGLLGSNKATEDRVKLFPHSCDRFVEDVQRLVHERTGKRVEALVYGDGAFKDPIGKIWELADPVVSPAYSSGLVGVTSEIKLKYIADNEFAGKRGDEAREAMVKRIRDKCKREDLVGREETEGTTPRRIIDLLGSLCDLVSGSGDKGTPVILIKGFFDNYATE